MITDFKEHVIKLLKDLIEVEPRLKVRYGFDEYNNLHLVEVSPDALYDELIVETYEDQLTLACIDFDPTSSVVFFTKGDQDFVISECLFEAEGEGYGFQFIDFNKESWSSMDLTYENHSASIIPTDLSFALAA